MPGSRPPRIRRLISPQAKEAAKKALRHKGEGIAGNLFEGIFGKPRDPREGRPSQSVESAEGDTGKRTARQQFDESKIEQHKQGHVKRFEEGALFYLRRNPLLQRALSESGIREEELEFLIHFAAEIEHTHFNSSRMFLPEHFIELLRAKHFNVNETLLELLKNADHLNPQEKEQVMRQLMQLQQELRGPQRAVG